MVSNAGKRIGIKKKRKIFWTYPQLFVQRLKHNIFNRKLFKLSYSCMPKMVKEERTDIRLCNSREKCVVGGKCLLQ